MKFPRCGSRSCQEESQHYLIGKKIYVCYAHKATKYSADDSIQLVPPGPTKLLLKVIDQCRKELLVSPQSHGYLAPESEYNGFDSTIKEAISHIMSSLNDAISTNQFFKLVALLQEAKNLEDFVMKDQLFIKHSVVKSWKKALAVIEGTTEKSAALVAKELREEYDRLLERTASKLKQQRDRILEEIGRTETELSIKKTKIKELKDEFKEQEESNRQDMKEQKEGYEEKIRYLISIQDEIEQSKMILIDEAKEKDLKISELKKDIESKNEELEESHENIKQLNQKVETSVDQERVLRERIKELVAGFIVEKKRIGEERDGEMQKLRNYYEVKSKESCEESDREQQEKLEKNDIIEELEKKVLNIAKERDKERAEHQTLKQAHADLQKEKQRILQRHSEEQINIREEIRRLKRDHQNKLRNKNTNSKRKIKKVEEFHENQLYDEQQRLQEEIDTLEMENEVLEEKREEQNAKIKDLEKETKKAQRSLNLALQENKLLEQLTPFTTYTQKDFDTLCRSIDQHFLKGFYGWDGDIKYKEGNTSFELCLNRTVDLELIKNVKKRIPNFKDFSIDSYLEEYSECINNFAKNYFPNKVQTFSFYPDIFFSDKSIHHYMAGLIAMAPRVQKKLSITKFRIGQRDLIDLLSNFKHVECFRLNMCEINLSSVPFLNYALENTQIQKLQLIYDFYREDDTSNFKILIRGLSQSEDFRESLEEISVEALELTEEEISYILEENGFENVKIEVLVW
ncbi:unnamed protein product [Moneuplotes crassus]|uniref:Uncharacterized protein n=1 Tax=Euplotes crassus TaxID=5936 RepID=A0AAD2DAE3_EUPCR|nr:unnamed protein product [Moneuplotes crassus]